MINTFFLLISFLFSLGQLGRISFLGQQVNGYLYEIFLSLGLLILFIKYKFKPFFYYSRKYSSFFIFILICLFSLVFRFNQYTIIENTIAFLYCLRLILYLSYFIYLIYFIKNKPRVKQSLIMSIWVFILITFIICISQYLIYPDLRNLIYLGWDPHLFRVFGSFFDTQITATILGLIFLFIFHNFDKLKLNKFLRKTKYPILFLNLILIVLTFSRNVYIFFLLTFIFLLIKKKYFSKLIILLTIFTALVILVPKPFGSGVDLTRIFSINSRIADYKKAINLWIKSPVIGYGYNRIRFLKKENILSHAASSFSSSYLIILVTTGVIGLFAFLFIIYQLSRIGFVSLIYILFVGGLSLADNVILHPFVLFLLLSLLITELKKNKNSNLPSGKLL